MDYTIIVNGRSYDLPKKTLAVVDKLDQVLRVDSSNLSARQKFERLHDFVKELAGSDAAKEMFGSENLSEIDLSEVTIAVRKIIDAYDEPVASYNSEKASAVLSSIPLDKLNSMMKAVDKMSTFPAR